MAINALENYLSGNSGEVPSSGGKMKIKRVGKKIAKVVGKSAATLAPYALPLAFDAAAVISGNPELAPVGQVVGQSIGADLNRRYGYGGARIMNKPAEFHHSVYPPGLQSYTGKLKGGVVKKRISERGAIVSKVMKQYKMSLPEASSFVKQNGLY